MRLYSSRCRTHEGLLKCTVYNQLMWWLVYAVLIMWLRWTGFSSGATPYLYGSHAISLHKPQHGSYFWSSFSSGAICRTSLTFYQHCLPCQMAWTSVFPNQWRAETCRVSGVTQWLDVPTAPPITVFQCSFWFGCPPLYRDPVNTQGHRPTAAHLPWLLTARYCAPQISILSVVDQLYSHFSILGNLSSLLCLSACSTADLPSRHVVL